jgi:plasmid stability protein
MPSITIKDIPDKLLERLRRRAQEDKRSMNREAIHLLDLALAGQSVDQDTGGTDSSLAKARGTLGF